MADVISLLMADVVTILCVVGVITTRQMVQPVVLPSGKVESYRDINVTGWSVMKSTLENQQELLQRGSRNIRRLLPQYMAIITPLVTLSP